MDRSKIRNFIVAAHVDHGKSSLSDRLLEIAGNIKLGDKKSRQVLDDLKVERERGITVKARTASMLYGGHLLNLIDTPGHVDFAFEVKRSLRSCQGALLLIDSTQGVQAQTLANYNLAKDAGLTIIPVITKLDLPHSDPARAIEQIESIFGLREEEVIWTSAKTGEGCEEVLPEIIRRLPPPPEPPVEVKKAGKFRAVVVDSWYDQFKGTVCLIFIQGGRIEPGDSFFSDSQASLPKESPIKFSVHEVGFLTPQLNPSATLETGQVGYLFGGIKENAHVRIGDFLSECFEGLTRDPVELQKRKINSTPKVYTSVYPLDNADFDELRKSIERLMLNDSSVIIKAENNGALGNGFRCGFLGKLHMEVFFQRLDDEFGTAVIATAPAVPYTVIFKDGTKFVAETPSQLPDESKNIARILEPMASVTIVTPLEYMGHILKIMKERRGRQEVVENIDEARMVMKYTVPWQEVIVDLQDELKNATSGFCTFEYDEAHAEESKVKKVSILVNGNPVDALTFIAHESLAHKRGRAAILKLKSVIRRQQFEVVIQAAIGGKIIAKERIPPFRKDVLTKSGKTVGGGDMTRKRKLLEKQKSGKKRLKSVGNVELDQAAFFAVLERRKES